MSDDSESNRLLSPRETAIMQLTAQGLSAKEIAIELDIANRTVERHIDNVRTKLKARNRTHAIALCMDIGLIRLK